VTRCSARTGTAAGSERAKSLKPTPGTSLKHCKDIGVGQHDGPRKAGETLLATASKLLALAQPTKDFPLPKEIRTRFYFLTLDGAYTAEALEEELANGRHPASPLFYKTQDVLAQARLVDTVTESATSDR
jgi:hypothetical protein